MAENRRVTIRGLDTEEPRIGYMILGLTVATMAAVLGRLVPDMRSSITSHPRHSGWDGQLPRLAPAWIATFVRSATPALSPGASASLVVIGGLIIAAGSWRTRYPS